MCYTMLICNWHLCLCCNLCSALLLLLLLLFVVVVVVSCVMAVLL